MGKFDGILIVSDMDGTFLGNGGRVVPENIEAIEYFKSEGGRFTIASGRIFYVISPIAEVPKSLNAPAVLSNGSCFYDFSKEKIIDASFIDGKTVSKALNFIRQNHKTVGIVVNSGIGIISDLLVRGIENYSKTIGEDMFHLLPFGEWDTDLHGVFKVVFRGEPDELDVIRAELESGFPDTSEFAKSCETFLECQKLGITKADRVVELKRLIEKESGRKMKLFACGDYENDITMLRAADFSVCPENAIPEVKELVDLCLCHCDRGLIADLIDRLDKDESLRKV